MFISIFRDSSNTPPVPWPVRLQWSLCVPAQTFLKKDLNWCVSVIALAATPLKRGETDARRNQKRENVGILACQTLPRLMLVMNCCHARQSRWAACIAKQCVHKKV